MPVLSVRLRRLGKDLSTRARVARMVAKGLLSTDHPVNVHLIPMRRCNLACKYCNEYDDFSPPVALDVLRHRVDLLHKLGTTVITISGGEPLLHPNLEDLIRYIRSRGILAGLITNGYLLVQKRIESLNRAGLDYLQISIDNAQPDEVSVKSLKVLDKKLQLLAEHAVFHVNINSVVGGGVEHPWDALKISERAVALGFSSTVGIIHDGSGQLKPLSPIEKEVYDVTKRIGKSSFARMNYFQENIANGKPNNWKCRAGARYLYISEDGLVHYCSQQRGAPAVPLEEYSIDDIRREDLTPKTCAPSCTISCVHQTSYMDFWRGNQTNPPVSPNLKTADTEPTHLLVQIR